MVFLIAILTAILFVLIFEKPLKKNPVPFYLIFAGLSLAVVIVDRLGISFEGFFGNYIYPLFSKATLGAGFFVLVMYAVTFKNGSRSIKLLMSLRGELSIIASILTLGHIVAYGITYLSKLFTAPSKMQPVVLIATIFSVVMVVVLMPLFITSFKKIRRKMNPLKWKKLQRFAYGFYFLVYLHVVLFNITAALRGSERSIVNVCVYSAVFLWYLICRILKYRSTKNKNLNLNLFRYVSLVIVLILSVGLFFALKLKTAAKENEVPEEASISEPQPEETSVVDGTYNATALGYEGNITVEIVVKDGEVTDVYFASYEDDEEYKTYSDDLIKAIKEHPMDDIDTVSGATFSTRGVIKAYEAALKKAGIEKQ